MSGRANGKNGKQRRRTKREPKPEKPVLGVMVPGSRGGMIWQGRPANPRAGPGRPKSAILARLAGSFDERIPLLEKIADAEVTVRELKCPRCFHKFEAVTEVPPSYDDRLRAMDIMGKLSLGAHSGVPVDEVRRRVARTIDVIKEILTPEYSKPLIDALRPVWH